MSLLRRQPPAGFPITRELAKGRAARLSGRDVSGELSKRINVSRVDLFASGREALRAGLAFEAGRRDRAEVVVPAYTCYSVPASAVAAGLRVRLVDVDERGWIDTAALERSDLDRSAAVIVSNLFGIPEPIARVRAAARAAGAAVVDDAAQALGARDRDGPVAGRGDLGLLSFARGKPLPALGGGGLAWRETPQSVAPPPLPEMSVQGAWLSALAHDAALSPWLFRWVAALPGLHVGETRFDPGFRRGPISGRSLALVAALLPRLEDVHAALRRRVERLAARLGSETRFEPLLAPPGATAVHPRLVLRAPSAAARDAALARLEQLSAGASRFYPASLDCVPELRPHRVAGDACPGARDLAARILTLPSGSEPTERELERLVAALRESEGSSQRARCPNRGRAEGADADRGRG